MQTVSLDVARRLAAAVKAAGVKGPRCELEREIEWRDMDGIEHCEYIKLHTTDELLAWMPACITLNRHECGGYVSVWDDADKGYKAKDGQTPADALAELAIWLLQHHPEEFK